MSTKLGDRSKRFVWCGGARAGTGRRLLTVLTQVRFLPPQLTEVIRLDEEPASKAGAGKSSVVGSSPTASAL
jgi:hypothetical protein